MNANDYPHLTAKLDAANKHAQTYIASKGLPIEVEGSIRQTQKVNMIRGSDIAPLPISWIWRDFLARGKMHIFGGAPGTGKTTIALTFAAIISTGGNWPDGSKSPSGNVVIWSGEDDPADTLIPRLTLCGADLSRIYFVDHVEGIAGKRAFDPSRDMDSLRLKLEEIGDVAMLIIDPIVSVITGDSHKNAEVRRGLQPLVDLTSVMNVALLGITHFSKGTKGKDPVERLTGSLAFGALARIVLVAAKTSSHDSSDSIFCKAKSNIGPDGGGFKYSLHQQELPGDIGISSSSVNWGGPVDGSALGLLEPEVKPVKGKLDAAIDFLNEILADGPVLQSVVEAKAAAEGHSEATLRRAREEICSKPIKVGMDGGWLWSLQSGC